HRRYDLTKLHKSRDYDPGQWFNLSGSGEQLGWHGKQQRSNADRERVCGGTDDHNATCEPDGDRGTDGELCGNGKWDSTAELSVEIGRASCRERVLSAVDAD